MGLEIWAHGVAACPLPGAFSNNSLLAFLPRFSFRGRWGWDGRDVAVVPISFGASPAGARIGVLLY
jgi:hypothetical protein